MGYWDDITEEHVLKAVETINRGESKIRPSTWYDVIIDGKPYPPKEVLRYAYKEMTGKMPENDFYGGKGKGHANDLLRKIGFEIVDRRDKNASGTKQDAEKSTQELNQILFGPPGTGKTYNTINKALEICGENISGKDRREIKELFEQKVDEGRIVFTTFHQSMTYEDFVEGIKPVEPVKDGDPVIYRVEQGIFRRICVEASFLLAQDAGKTKQILDFSESFDDFVQEIEEKLSKEQPCELKTKNAGKIVVDGISQQGNLLVKHKDHSNIYTVSKQRIVKLHNAIPDLERIHNITEKFREIIGGGNATAYWSVLNAIRKRGVPKTGQKKTEYDWEDKNIAVQTLKKEDYKGPAGKPFVLIIDEINRGNVSQIFGELITLIEGDKRLGNPEAIQVQLPYSKDFFGVPPNLYIIGTMNTADRGVEALDTALRRRFSFTEMAPEPKLIKGIKGMTEDIDLSELLEVINERIERLSDKDHMIGHSYFLSLDSLDELKKTFQNKIIPLLQEYFFGDYGKIGLVLGKGFVEKTKISNEDDFFARFEDYDSSFALEKDIYHLKNLTKMSSEEFIMAIKSFLNKNDKKE